MAGTSRWKIACLCAVSDGVPRRSLTVALVVGTALNLINQGDAIFGTTSVNWLKLALTFCVPYVVCTYGAVSFALKTGSSDRATTQSRKPTRHVIQPQPVDFEGDGRGARHVCRSQTWASIFADERTAVRHLGLDHHGSLIDRDAFA